jgi:hypothetical protein
MGRAAGYYHSARAGANRRPSRRNGARGPYRWTDETLEGELRRFTRGRTEFPTAREFADEFRSDLRGAVSELGGALFWSEVIGLPLPPSRQRSSYHTSDAVREARAIIKSLGYLPGEPTLRRMGHGRLATRVRNTRGGASGFAAEHGLSDPHTPDSTKPPETNR